jgi:hypothetical protein
MRAISVDLPAFGKPTRPTSASSFSSSRRSLISPSSPGWIAGSLVDERPDRHGELEVGAAVAGAVGAHAVLAALGGELRMETKVNERVDVRAGDDVYRAAVAAVAAARAAARDELLAPEGEAAFPAVARFNVDIYFVDEHRIWLSGHLVIWSFNRTFNDQMTR